MKGNAFNLSSHPEQQKLSRFSINNVDFFQKMIPECKPVAIKTPVLVFIAKSAKP